MEPVRNKRPVEDVFHLEDDSNYEYKQDLLKLKGDAIKLIDRLITYDLRDSGDREDAVRTGRRLRERINEVLQEHLDGEIQGEQGRQDESPEAENFHVSVEKVKDLRRGGIIGGHWTHVAIKNENSFLVGTYEKGVLGFENGSQFYSGKFPKDQTSLWDIIYTPPSLNCYFLAFDEKLYRKNIDDQPPLPFLTVQTSSKMGSYLRFSDHHKRLIINKCGENLSVVNPFNQ